MYSSDWHGATMGVQPRHQACRLRKCCHLVSQAVAVQVHDLMKDGGSFSDKQLAWVRPWTTNLFPQALRKI